MTVRALIYAMRSAKERATAFRALHRGSKLFVLPNAWDVPSARVFEEVGFPAVATSSAGVCVSLGFPDGEGIPRDVMIEAIGRIATRLSVPLSADVVSGFGNSSKEVVATVRRVIEAGAVGINIEDKDLKSGALHPLKSQVEKLAALRTLGEESGIPFVINARTDAPIDPKLGPKERLEEAIERAAAYRDAGADCVYPIRLVAASDISAFVGELSCPVNVMIRPGLPTLGELQDLGVRRVSFGPSASYAALAFLKRAGEEIVKAGSFRSLVENALTFDELNALALPKDRHEKS